jgi:hypothetical protein
METIEFNQIENGVEEIFFNVVSIESTIKLNTEFSLLVNQEDKSILKLYCTLSAFNDDTENTFMEIKSYGIYKTDNQDENLTLDKIENGMELMEDLLPSVNETLSFITKRGLGDSIELPMKLPEKEIEDPSES